MAIHQSIDDAASELARDHKAQDLATTAIYRSVAKDEIRLVEVTGSVGTTNDVLPFRFAARPDEGLPYPSVIVLLSPDEWRSVTAGKLKLPSGWGAPEELKKVG